MIRRGLQSWLVVGIVALGAAPCFAVVLPPVGATVIISGHHPLVNGEWVVVSDVGFGVHLMNRDMDSAELIGANGDYTDLQEVSFYASDNSWGASLNAEMGNFRVWNVEADDWDTVVFPDPYAVWSGGRFGPGGPSDPYPENFPDWESAAVKVPLGFGMGMAFWAAALALIIPIKWAKDLASAAS